MTRSSKPTGGFVLSGLEYLTSLAAWKQLPVGTKKLIEQYGDWKMYMSMVTRRPVSAFIETLTNTITAGRLAEFKMDKGYDNYYHLGTVLFLMNEKNVIKSLQYEKIDRPVLHEVYAGDDIEGKYFIKHSAQMTLIECVTRHMERMGESYYVYDAFSYNCQNFMMNFYESIGELTPKLQDFIVQPIDELVATLPNYSKHLANIITNLSAGASNWMEYFGFKPLQGGAAAAPGRRPTAFSEMEKIIRAA